MPHIIVKLWPGKSESQKKKLAEALVTAVQSVIGYGEESFSVAIEEVEAKDWAEKVYRPDIVAQQEKLYKEPGYRM
ncbi:MAG: tautomerase family protein [Lewinellaceae bacterium]|nr:tautomerase family protein [Sinomicrobium sp.]MCB9307951.1 tautomerase family protein [Lewinellaceae bacterium]MCB9355643.1 tautomerase family protein [Lewinellaceae bacterium]